MNVSPSPLRRFIQYALLGVRLVNLCIVLFGLKKCTNYALGRRLRIVCYLKMKRVYKRMWKRPRRRNKKEMRRGMLDYLEMVAMAKRAHIWTLLMNYVLSWVLQQTVHNRRKNLIYVPRLKRP